MTMLKSYKSRTNYKLTQKTQTNLLMMVFGERGKIAASIGVSLTGAELVCGECGGRGCCCRGRVGVLQGRVEAFVGHVLDGGGIDGLLLGGGAAAAAAV